MSDLEAAISLLLSREFTAKELGGDTLLAERIKAAREYGNAATALITAQRMLRAARDVDVDAKAEAIFQQAVNDATSEVERVGDRLLQLAAASPDLGGIN